MLWRAVTKRWQNLLSTTLSRNHSCSGTWEYPHIHSTKCSHARHLAQVGYTDCTSIIEYILTAFYFTTLYAFCYSRPSIHSYLHCLANTLSQYEQSAAPPAIVPNRYGLISITFFTVWEAKTWKENTEDNNISLFILKVQPQLSHNTLKLHHVTCSLWALNSTLQPEGIFDCISSDMVPTRATMSLCSGHQDRQNAPC